MAFNKNLYKFQNKLFDTLRYITIILYILIVLGLSTSAPEYLEYLNSFIKIYISLFLIYRFNPFLKVKFTRLDAKISFSAGVFLLATTAVASILKNYLSEITQYVKTMKEIIKNN